MSTYHLSDAVRPLVDWTTGYAVRRRLGPAGAARGPLTPRDAAHVIRTIDVVCDDASPRDPPFEHFAALDELDASLADWLRHVSPDRASMAPGAHGSGKHDNWSIATDTGRNLLDPGETPADNLRFLFLCAAVMRAVDTHHGLLRAATASAANDHRLGANEAPPAIVSMFLGAELEAIFETLVRGEAIVTAPVFDRHRVLSERKLETRYEVFVEQYATSIGIEGATAAQMTRTLLIPAALHQRRLIESAGGPTVATLTEELDEVLEALIDAVRALEAANASGGDEGAARALRVRDEVLPAMAAVRAQGHRLETLVADELWPLPRYAEMLYVR